MHNVCNWHFPVGMIFAFHLGGFLTVVPAVASQHPWPWAAHGAFDLSLVGGSWGFAEQVLNSDESFYGRGFWCQV